MCTGLRSFSIAVAVPRQAKGAFRVTRFLKNPGKANVNENSVNSEKITV